MDFPESKYHVSGVVPSEFYATIGDDEDTSDNPTVVIPRPAREEPTVDEWWWFLPF